MSVINQMLRDLDERQGRTQTATPMTPVYKKQAWRPSWWMMLVAIVVIVAVLVLYPAPSLDVFKSKTPATPVVTETESENSQPLIEEKQPVVPETSKTVGEASTMSVPVQDQAMASASSQPVASETVTKEALVPQKEQDEQLPGNVEVEPEVIADQARIIKTAPARTSLEDAKEHYDDLVKTHGQPLTSDQLNEVLRIDPTFHQARIEQLSLLSQTNAGQFEQFAQSASETWPEIHQYRQMLARSWVMEKPAAAYRLLTSQMPSIESAPDYHGLVAYSAQQMGDLTLASKQYQLLLSSYPERADWWLALGLIEEQRGQTAQALRAFQQSLRFPGLSANIRAYAEQRVKAIQGY